jgi:hypothetical protein
MPAGLADTIQAQIVDEERQRPQQIEESYRFSVAISEAPSVMTWHVLLVLNAPLAIGRAATTPSHDFHWIAEKPMVTFECRPAGARWTTISETIMNRWIKLVALLLLMFTMYDVSVPETCLAEGLAIAASSTQVQPSHQDGGRSSCQFEEDCMACAHILPGTHFVLTITHLVELAEPYLFLPAQGGVPALPYHPPRA